MEGRIGEYVGKAVVIDTATSYVYIGRLTEVENQYLVLADVDVHDSSDTTTTKERYILDTRRYTVKTNRKEVLVMLNKVVSLSLLDDVIKF